MEIDSFALVISGVANSALGLAFWAVAARLFPTAQVGIAGTVINTAVLLATLSNLSLGALYERFLPASGHRAVRLVAGGWLLTSVFALLLGGMFVLLGPSDRLFESAGAAWAFPLCVVVLASFALSDSILVGLRVARWAAAKNVFHAVGKLALLAVLAVAGFALTGSVAIVLAWMVPAVLAVFVVQVLILVAGRALPEPAVPTLPPRRELWTYFGSTFGITALATVTPLALPLIVVVAAGATDAAYFTVAWTVVAAVLMAPGYIAGPFIAEVAAEPDRLGELLRRFLRLFGIITVLSTAALLVGGPLALWLVGSGYLLNAWALMVLMALVPLVGAPAIVFAVLCRVHRSMAPAVWLQVGSTIGVVACAALLVPHTGIIGVGYTFVVVETTISLLAAAPLVRRLRNDLYVGSERQLIPVPAP